jgi:nucleoside 2-deoxyribosyltransferase
MKIYFACSITGGREFESVYQEIVAALAQDGHQIPTAHLVESGVGAVEAGIDPLTIYARDVDWIRESDVLIAEVSVPSHGVGYEIGFALGIGKPVLCVYQAGRKVSKMITGNPDEHLQVTVYQDAVDAMRVIKDFLARILK